MRVVVALFLVLVFKKKKIKEKGEELKETEGEGKTHEVSRSDKKENKKKI